MGNLKNNKKKLLAKEITGVVIGYMMGLNEENKLQVHKAVRKFSQKTAKLYYAAIKKQHKEMKQMAKGKITTQPGTNITPVVHAVTAKAS